jgi:hypothetical protein
MLITSGKGIGAGQSTPFSVVLQVPRPAQWGMHKLGATPTSARGNIQLPALRCCKHEIRSACERRAQRVTGGRNDHD